MPGGSSLQRDNSVPRDPQIAAGANVGCWAFPPCAPQTVNFHCHLPLSHLRPFLIKVSQCTQRKTYPGGPACAEQSSSTWEVTPHKTAFSLLGKAWCVSAVRRIQQEDVLSTQCFPSQPLPCAEQWPLQRAVTTVSSRWVKGHSPGAELSSHLITEGSVACHFIPDKGKTVKKD